MDTFFNIIQTIIKCNKNVLYHGETEGFDSSITCEPIYKNILLIVHYMVYRLARQQEISNNRNDNIRMKLITIDTIFNTLCINQINVKQQLQNLIITTQKHCNAFSRLAYIIKWKRCKIAVDCDLSMTPLNINHCNTVVLMYNRFKYMFSLQDLINIIETALSNSPNFFIMPIAPKNPYNNAKFDKSTLYNIYFKLLIILKL